MVKRTGRVRIELYASKLKNVAGAFKGTSDPYAVVTLLPNHPCEKPKVIGMTEVYVLSIIFWSDMVRLLSGLSLLHFLGE